MKIGVPREIKPQENNHDEQNRLNDDLNSINDLIKDKIWIKKNF
jgi:hypothetical protein